MNDAPVEFGLDGLRQLVAALRERGLTVVGPTVRDGAVVLGELASADELPFGTGVAVEAGRYRLRPLPEGDRRAFAHSAGPQSWKNYLHPARERLWSADRAEDGGFTVRPDEEPAPRYAFLGVRPCDLRAIAVLDRVLVGGRYEQPSYRDRRSGAFVVVVECGEPGAVCFCASMGTGPGLPGDAAGYDLALTEIGGPDGELTYLARAGSEEGQELLDEIGERRAAAEATLTAAAETVDRAAERMGRAMETDGLRGLLAGSLDSPHWDEVASRCLACANCTLVCPTCFCTTTEEVTDLTGEHAERWQRWDSCFDLESTHLAGAGPVRGSVRSRYRQWLTHKLGTWHDQFGSSGCVGCGRCIAWCPAGIDLTAEVAALRAEHDRPSGEASKEPSEEDPCRTA
ncbi:4Fe-4S dicluster domain-containing protein [Phaeacidiphilus oryzae]|uniref:4Fe-4S dicluster domain-containing protein n=1 Tax=Phaeacidiphilus oryzae TaxID=348818 RepID=UPI00055CE0F6|nr:4Fe-4S dicluster domain-containing protein [Phaeacidiphilus oryzae]